MKSRVLLAAAFALALVSCAKKHSSDHLVAPWFPSVGEPTDAVLSLAMYIRTRNVTAYTAQLTDNYAFVFAADDSAGNGFPNRCMDRADETAAMQHLLVGGGDLPPASEIAFAIEDPLVAQVDPRPGMDPKWHRLIHTNVNLRLTYRINGDSTVTSIVGSAHFYVVRGDSAALPAGGAPADSAVWYISRWEDETASASGAPGLHADGAYILTLGGLKARYIGPLPAAPAR
jgi:hypothetical protein